LGIRGIGVVAWGPTGRRKKGWLAAVYLWCLFPALAWAANADQPHVPLLVVDWWWQVGEMGRYLSSPAQER